MENCTSESLLEDSNTDLAERVYMFEVGERVCGTGCGFSDDKNKEEEAAARSMAAKKLLLAAVLCVIFIAVEIAGGLISNSLAVLTDAAHLLSDVASFGISLFAIWASSWEATPRQTYGFYRIEILGALLSIQLIWLLTGIIIYEAIYRIIHISEAIDGRLMFVVATFGLFVNILMVFVLGHYGHGEHGHSHPHLKTLISDHSHSKGDHDHGDHSHQDEVKHDNADIHDHHHHDLEGTYVPQELSRQKSFIVDIDMDDTSKTRPDISNINVKGAWLHVFGDLIQSIGVMIGGAIIWAKPEWRIVDLICTLLFSVLVLATTIKMLRDTVEILMESTPREIDVKKIEKELCEIQGVIAIHELHIWAITMGKTSLACHVTINPDADSDVILKRVLAYCDEVFNISHVTVQIERHQEYLPPTGEGN